MNAIQTIFQPHMIFIIQNSSWYVSEWWNYNIVVTNWQRIINRICPPLDDYNNGNNFKIAPLRATRFKFRFIQIDPRNSHSRFAPRRSQTAPKGKRSKCELSLSLSCVSQALKFFSTNDRAGRVYASVRAWVNAVCNAHGPPKICLSGSRYTLDVTSPRTIRKNTNRRESYEGGGVSSSPTAIARACIKHDIPATPHHPSAPRHQARSSFPWNVRASCPKSDRDIYLYLYIYAHTCPIRTCARKICIERFVRNSFRSRSYSGIRNLELRKFIQLISNYYLLLDKLLLTVAF